MLTKMLRNIILLMIVFFTFSCSNKNDDSNTNIECQGYMSARINGRYFYTTDVNIPSAWLDDNKIDIWGIGDNDEIVLMPPATAGTHNIGMEEYVQAGYYDKLNTTHVYWSAGNSTDGTTGGQIVITNIIRNKKVTGTFNFTVKINGNLITISDGIFSIENVDVGKDWIPTK